jgi:hypothetical protein
MAALRSACRGAELGGVLFHGAADAIFVDCQEMKLVGVGHPGVGLGDGGVEFGVVGVLRGMFGLPEGEDGVFQRAGAVEAPAVLGDGLGEIDFERAYGSQSFTDAVAVFVKSFPVFRGVDDDLAGESVAEGVEGGTLFTFDRTGAGGTLGVFAVGVELGFGHKRLLNPRPHGRG